MFPLVIELIYWSLASNDIRTLIFGILRELLRKKDSSSESLKKVLKEENVREDELDQPFTLFNVNIIKKLIKLVTQAELKVLTSEINKIKNGGKVGSTLKELDKLFSNDEKKELDKIQQLKNKASNIDSKTKDFYLENWIDLSSSWFKKGYYELRDKEANIGQLTAMFQSDNSKSLKWYGPYTYPAFPVEIWLLMIEQKGKNGNGAGTIFWKYWNKVWLPSQIRKYVKDRLKKSKGITKGAKTDLGLFPNIKSQEFLPFRNINIAKTNAYIYRLEKGFPKLKTYQNLSSNEIGSSAWRENRKNFVSKNQKGKNYYQTYKRNTALYKQIQPSKKVGFNWKEWQRNNS